MSSTIRPSPKRSPRSVTSENLQQAQELLKNPDNVSTVDISDAPALLHGVQAIRHHSIIANEKQKIKKCDFLISELNNIINRTKQTTPKKEKWTPRTVKSRQAQPVPASCSPKSVEITEAEQNQMDRVVESLINGSEIDTIDPSAVPKLEIVLKARKAKAVDESDYATAKIIEYNIQSLSKFVANSPTGLGTPSPISLKSSHNKEFVSEAKNKIENAKKRLERIKEDLEKELARIRYDSEISKDQIHATIESEKDNIDLERADIEAGVGFKASKRLLEQRQIEAMLAKNSQFDEAAVAKKIADTTEMEERREFDRKNKSLISKKEKTQEKIHEMKIQQADKFWDNLLEKAQIRAETNMKKVEDEINGIKEWYKKITGKDYMESESVSGSTSEANFDIDDDEKEEKNESGKNNDINNNNNKDNSIDDNKDDSKNNKNARNDTKKAKVTGKITPNRKATPKKQEPIPIPTVVVNSPTSPRSGSASPRSGQVSPRSGQNSPRSTNSPK